MFISTIRSSPSRQIEQEHGASKWKTLKLPCGLSRGTDQVLVDFAKNVARFDASHRGDAAFLDAFHDRTLSRSSQLRVEIGEREPETPGILGPKMLPL